ncbi:hypothetical protein [Streptomyces sulphureus]|uniref:hypothetical protein n=1 Tax=Streptomyces sulphureus TaxID=47758 RepID=UPI000382B1DB|nr:hypothetical protein [Streptomyces sulphureus]
MTTAATGTLRRSADGGGESPPGGPALPPAGPPRRPRNRLLTLLIVVLLIAIPAGYVVISAFQSRDSGRDKERTASATSLTYAWPSKVQRRIYDVPVPYGATRVAHYEVNSWSQSRLYAEFRTDEQQLDRFLRYLGTSAADLEAGRGAITKGQADTVGWKLDEPDRPFSGTVRERADDRPQVRVVVDDSFKSRPRVYVVSTVRL